MNITPSLADVQLYAESGKYDVVPLSCQILSDAYTPIEVLRKLKNVSAHCFLLESVSDTANWGRYTFLGFDPKMELVCDGDSVLINNVRIETKNPSEYIRQILKGYRSPKIQDLPTFTGGLVGYFSYDYLGYSEPSLRMKFQDDEHFKEADLMLFDKVIAFDNYTQKIFLIVNIKLKDLDTEYKRGVLELEQLVDLLKNGEKKKEPVSKITGPASYLFDKQQYCQMVERAKGYIREGDIFQIVLSNRLSAPFQGTLFNTYRILRTVNPSPYMFYFYGTDIEMTGASPETLVKLQDGVLHTFPLAGTRPRGTTEEKDLELERELLADEKELAEHNMLVDLGRNDLGKISRFGTVKVEKLRMVTRYSHVMHIGSTVRGVIREECDALDAISAVLPAGTLSGAPKIRACQLIGELEDNQRGVYGGAIGYIDFSGNLDCCIAIRLAYRKGSTVYVRSGAGIVADSVPEKEYQECLNKAAAVVLALKRAEELNDDTSN